MNGGAEAAPGRGSVAAPAERADPALADLDGTLTKLHPDHEKAMRVAGGLAALPPIAGAIVADWFAPVWPGAIAGPVLLLALLLVLRIPHRRFAARGYAMGSDRLRVVRGIWFRSDTVVPFGRVQHIDVDRGPLERYYDLATLTLHTAGSHNASVHLPGLQHDRALAMREEIRSHIRREAA